MAASQIRLSNIFLNDRWPGVPTPYKGIPTDGWDNTVDNFKTTAATDIAPVPIGEKRSIYTDNSECPGWYTMMYLSYHDYSSVDISADFSDGNMFCSHYDGTKSINVGADSRSPYYVVGRCYTTACSEVTSGCPVAIPCATLEADSSVVLVTGDPQDLGYGDAFGWFWVGGVCPCKDATLLQGTVGSLAGADISADDDIQRTGDIIFCFTGATVMPFSNDISNVGDETGTVGLIPTAHGWACASS